MKKLIEIKMKLGRGEKLTIDEAHEICEFIDSFKKNIIDARNDGYACSYSGCESDCMKKIFLDGSSEDYFNETFQTL